MGLTDKGRHVRRVRWCWCDRDTAPAPHQHNYNGSLDFCPERRVAWTVRQEGVSWAVRSPWGSLMAWCSNPRDARVNAHGWARRG